MPRRLGQHFLASTSTLKRIASAALPGEPEPVIEIGPGRGPLTEYLSPRAASLHAIEVDQVLVHYLQEKFRGTPAFTVHHDDVLRADLNQWAPAVVAGNLPYYITSPIVDKVLRLGPLLRRAVFLVQREVAERMAAAPGSRDYGYLSVSCQVLARTRYLFTVPPGAFRPPPKVDSAVVLLEPHAKPLMQDVDDFLAFASACFTQKRKTLRNKLSGAYDRQKVEAQPEAKLRAEQLPIEQLVDLYRRLKP
ncbi:MAG TPA: 16S rRNA (adenine(1518)-N(6)/adenine(1519)-N(6))-dimethyltransferase RsmA [Bryobacteraceae bacterium]|nr:16S rRNA (adenine(1518)-N(6)/adenine(1519)-N(6))-dimethyltransferase RsmA [Bryobacteraceae bacterium]